MINAIISVFKYSALVLTILVLSHIIQVRGTTISQHVENGMNWVSGGRSHASITTRVTQQFSSALHRESKIEPLDSDITHDDQKELDTVIKKSSAHRR